MIALIDANNFFVSCERSLNPKLWQKPVAVLSNNDGCVISRSNEVKQLGIPMGAPYFKYRDIFEKHQIETFSVNFDLYQHLSNRVVKVLKTYSSLVEVYSIDESFVLIEHPDDISDWQWGIVVRESVYSLSTIPVSVGIANTKTLAKLAAARAKLADTGVFVIKEGDIPDLLAETDIGEIWGIGARLANRMRRIGIKTALDLIARSDKAIRDQFGIVGLRLKYELSGCAASGLSNMQSDKKGISSTRSFGCDVYDKNDLYNSLIKHLQTATRKLRRQQSVAARLQIFIRTGKHKKGQAYYARTARDLIIPTDSTLYLSSLISEMLEEIYKPGIKYYKSGIYLSEISKASVSKSQLRLEGEFNHRDRVHAVLDKIQRKYGDNFLRQACIPQRPKWNPRSEFKSYSQSLNDINNLPQIMVGEELEATGLINI